MRFAIILSAIVAAHGCALGQSTIALRANAVIDPSLPVTLGAIASIEGEHAEKLRDFVIIDETARTSGRTRVELDSLAGSLKAAGYKLGRMTFSGSECIIDPFARSAVERDAKTREASSADLSALASDIQTSDVRGAIAAKFRELYNVQPDAIRLSFRGLEHQLLTTSIEGMQVTIQPAAGGKSIPVQVRLFRGDEVIASGTVRVGVELRRLVLVTTAPIDRSEAICATNTMFDERWITPDVKPVNSEDAFGSVALSRIESGAVLETRAVKAPNVVTKGEIIRIDCLSGGIAIQSQARALEHGKQGQVIQFQTLNSKKIFRARVSGAGSAVADIGAR